MTTIHDVARHAGVSPVTVSRVINGAVNVNVVTREKVERAIRDLGYLPNLAARSLRSRQTSTLALIVPDITNAFWTTVARGVEDAAQSEGYLVWLCNTDESLEKQNGYINAVLQQRVDGVMIAPYDAKPENLRQLRELNTPAVVLDREVRGWDVDTIRSDSLSGAYALVQHLISLGHRRIAIVSGPSVTSTAEERIAGYCLALEDAGISIDPQLIRRGEYRARSGCLMTNSLFAEDLNPTAIVAANNVLAMGVLESLQAHGKTVPNDVALVAFDELPDLARFFPFLTVAVQPAYDMGMNAAQLLLSRINADVPLQPRHVILPSRLVLRHSCGRFLQQPGAEMAYPLLLKDQSETILVKPLKGIDEDRIKRHVPEMSFPSHASPAQNIALDQPDAGRLVAALQRLQPDRLPHLETQITSKPLLEYVLERNLPYRSQDLQEGKQAISPADYVDFAQRTGIDAIPCEIAWLPEFFWQGSSQEITGRIPRNFPSPSLTEHFTRLEGCLRAAQASKVGVFVSFRSFYAASLSLLGESSAQNSWKQDDLIRLMDVLAAYQQKVIAALCDRFATSLTFLAFRDSQAEWAEFGLQTELQRAEVISRFKQVILPAREHSLKVGIQVPGPVAALLPGLYQAGIDLFLAVEPEQNDLAAIQKRWQEKIAIMGGFPERLLSSGTRDEVEEAVRLYCQNLAARPGSVFGVSPSVTAAVRPELYLTMVRAARRYGKFN